MPWHQACLLVTIRTSSAAPKRYSSDAGTRHGRMGWPASRANAPISDVAELAIAVSRLSVGAVLSNIVFAHRGSQIGVT
jgi:hypothetical protein